MDEKTSELRRAVTQRLGEAMLAAVGLFVGQYLGEMAGGKKEEAEEIFSALLPPQETLAEEQGAEQRNESFDMQRFTALRGAVKETDIAKPPAPARTEEAAAERHIFPAAEQTTAEQAESGWAEVLRAAVPGETAESISRRFETDARRYDAGFELY